MGASATVDRACSSVSWTLATCDWLCQPWYAVPSYSMHAAQRMPTTPCGRDGAARRRSATAGNRLSCHQGTDAVAGTPCRNMAGAVDSRPRLAAYASNACPACVLSRVAARARNCPACLGFIDIAHSLHIRDGQTRPGAQTRDATGEGIRTGLVESVHHLVHRYFAGNAVARQCPIMSHPPESAVSSRLRSSVACGMAGGNLRRLQKDRVLARHLSGGRLRHNQRLKQERANRLWRG